MNTRIPPTPPRVLAEERDPMSETGYGSGFKVGIIRVVIPGLFFFPVHEYAA